MREPVLLELDAQRIITRAEEIIALGSLGSTQHPFNAAIGIVGAGGLGTVRRDQFIDDYPHLVRLAKHAIKAGFR